MLTAVIIGKGGMNDHPLSKLILNLIISGNFELDESAVSFHLIHFNILTTCVYYCVSAALYFGLHPASFSLEQSNQKSRTSPFQPLPPSSVFLNTFFTLFHLSES